jgi:hypothetical protein
MGPALVTFVSPSKTRSVSRCPRVPCVGPASGRVARGGSSARDEDSSHGVVKVRPSIGVGTGCPLRAMPLLRRAAVRFVPRNWPSSATLPSARSCHSPDVFRPCRSSRLRRFAPPGTFQVCCTLIPIVGFAKLRAWGPSRVAQDRWQPKLAAGRIRRQRPQGEPCRVGVPGFVFRTPRSRLVSTWVPTGPFGFPLPFPLALHPSELSPPQ